VTLNVYDLASEACDWALANTLLHPLGAGFFHCGVEVYGSEWSFFLTAPRGASSSRGTGVVSMEPCACSGFAFLQGVPMGTIAHSEEAVRKVVREMELPWPRASYNVLNKNCHHFCSELCTRLGLGAVPAWVTRLPETGKAMTRHAARCSKTAACCERSNCRAARDSQDIIVEAEVQHVFMDSRIEK